jgi:hypothetical protein
MSILKPLTIPIVAVILLLILAAGGYIVIPPCDNEDVGWGCVEVVSASKGWIALATNVAKNGAGDLHIDLTIQNETTEWSTLKTVANKPAVLKTGDGKSINCDTVFVDSGGHRLAPGFQIRGYTTGTKTEPKTQLIYVECKGAEAVKGSKLLIDVAYYNGEYNYYDKIANEIDATLEVDLDKIATDLKYPIVTPVEGLVKKPGDKIIGLNNMELTPVDVQRTDKGIQTKWQILNPSEYVSVLHVGIPPVVGDDGILYGLYQDPGSLSAPQTSPGKTSELTSLVQVPKEVKNLYMMVSVETGTRLFNSSVIDISDK